MYCPQAYSAEQYVLKSVAKLQLDNDMFYSDTHHCMKVNEQNPYDQLLTCDKTDIIIY